MEFVLPLGADFSTAIQPVVDIGGGWDLSGDAMILAAELVIAARSNDCLRYRVQSSSELETRVRRAPTAAGSRKKISTENADEDDSGYSGADYSDGERSVSSIDSSVDLDAESDAEAAGDADSGGDAPDVGEAQDSWMVKG